MSSEINEFFAAQRTSKCVFSPILKAVRVKVMQITTLQNSNLIVLLVCQQANFALQISFYSTTQRLTSQRSCKTVQSQLELCCIVDFDNGEKWQDERCKHNSKIDLQVLVGGESEKQGKINLRRWVYFLSGAKDNKSPAVECLIDDELHSAEHKYEQVRLLNLILNLMRKHSHPFVVLLECVRVVHIINVQHPILATNHSSRQFTPSNTLPMANFFRNYIVHSILVASSFQMILHVKLNKRNQKDQAEPDLKFYEVSENYKEGESGYFGEIEDNDNAVADSKVVKGLKVYTVCYFHSYFQTLVEQMILQSPFCHSMQIYITIYMMEQLSISC